jgi:hypothetical protein
MRDLAVLFIHLITTIARLAGPGGARSVVAESVLIKQQLLILNRARHRSPNLRVCDRLVAVSRALAEIEEALVRAFIIEELDDGRFTLFVPSVPTPLAGAVYILSRERVHPLDVPFTQAIKSISRWGSGSKDLVAAMKAGR